MELAVADSFGQAAQPFVDGFGERRVIFDARGERLDLLRVNPALTAAPTFESALRERAGRIAGFRHDSYARIRTIETERPAGSLLILSDHVRGVRLSTLLAAAEKRSVPVESLAAHCLIRQLVHATAAWREHMPDTVHGALAPDRIMIAPDGRLVVVEHVFGSALEQLRYSRQRYWEELGVALPATFRLTINARADVFQVGTVALALLLGRRLGPTDRLEEVPSALGSRLPPTLRTWVLKSLQIDPVSPFASVLDARAAIDDALGETSVVAEHDALLLFMARCLALDIDTSPFNPEGDEVGDTTEGNPRSDDLPDVDLETRIEALKTFLARRSAGAKSDGPEGPPPHAATVGSEVPQHTTTTGAEDPPLQTPDPLALLGAATSPPAREKRRRVNFPALPEDWTPRLWIAAITALVVGVALVALVIVVPWSGEPATGALSIETRPAGVAVTIDGTPRGVTPLAIDLPAGDHVIELATGTNRRQIPVTIRAGSQSSQFLEMTGAGAEGGAASELRIRTEPLGASVTVDGRYVGRSPVSVGDLSPGAHTVVLQNASGSVTEQVLIEAGKTAALFVPLAAPASTSTAAGWISVAAPVDVQIFEGGRFLGSSRIDRIMLPTGRHELEITNDALGFRERREVRVTAGQVAPVRLTWPMGNLAINAVPWAEAFVDGKSVGETPIGNIQIPIGPHEIVFRHPQLGERTASVTVTTQGTAKVGVDLRTK